MAVKPIIFSTPMVLALLAGRKTQTRRLLSKDQQAATKVWADEFPSGKVGWFCDVKHQYGKRQAIRPAIFPGDKLYVREAHAFVGSFDPQLFITRADYPRCVPSHFENVPQDPADVKWRPSIHMPRENSRMFLIIREMRVQRLQDISREDCAAEGHQPLSWISEDPEVHLDAARDWFMDLWDSLHGKPGERWADNPWIYALSFDVFRGNIDE